MLGLSPFVMVMLILIINELHLPFVISLIILNIGSVTIYIVPFSPLMITYGLSGFLSRQPYLLRIIINFYGKFIPDLKEILDKTILSKINNLTKIAFIIALSFTFIIVPLVASESLQHYDTKIQSFRIGADLALENFDNNIINESTLKKIDAVSSVTTIQTENYQFLYLFYVNTTSYTETINPEEYWNVTKESLLQLDTSSILVTEGFLKSLNVNVGDTFNIKESEYTITGLFGSIGGTDYYSKSIPMVILNSNINKSSNNVIHSRMVIKFKDPHDVQSIEETINSLKMIDLSISVLSQYPIGSNNNFDILKFVLNIVDVQAYLLSFLSLGSLAFLTIIRIRDRSREIGTWRSRGLDKNQLRKLITVELFVLSTFGFAIGILSGGILTFVVHYILSSVIFGQYSIIPYDFILPLNFIFIVLIYALGTILLTFIINYWTFTMNLSKQMRYEDYMR
jgi:ABC-type lipoprotein release transport system permease subunit